MEYSEDHIALAAEYALGTLDADERAQVETMMSADAEFTAIVRAWEYKLGALNQMVGSIEPPLDLWDRISLAVKLSGEVRAPSDLVEEQAAMTPLAPIGEAVAAVESRTEAPPAPPREQPPSAHVVESPADSNVVQLRGRVRSYRNLAVAMSAIAAVLLAIIGVQVYSPGLLPGLSGKPANQVAEVRPTPTPTRASPSPVPSAQYVALLQGAAGGPAFILTVDTATKNFTVRKAGAPPIDANRSYELWLISDRLQNRPRSLGVIGASEFTSRTLLTAYDSEVINTATYAVTLEQAGGSPDGAPHSQPVFIGKLIETVPPTPMPAPTQNR
jgi:anti-sigma-K factor RskA